MKLITVILIYSTTMFMCYCQDTDTLCIIYKKNYLENIVKDSLERRYDLTKTYEPNIGNEYPLDSLRFHIVPLLSLQKEKVPYYKCSDHIENYIDFNIHADELKVILEYKNDMIGHFLTRFFYDEKNPRNKAYDILNEISFQNYTGPKIVDGQFGYIDIFKLSKDFFVFTITEINAVCILDKGKIYVVRDYNETSYKKIPLNKYIHEEYGKKGVRKMFSRNKKPRYKKYRKCNPKKDVSNGLSIKLDVYD